MSGTFRVLLVRFFFFNQIVVTQVFSVCEISSRTCEFSLCKLYLSKISTALINISPGKRVLTCSTCQFPCSPDTGQADCRSWVSLHHRYLLSTCYLLAVRQPLRMLCVYKGQSLSSRNFNVIEKQA